MAHYLNQTEAAEYVGVSLNTFKNRIRPYLKQKRLPTEKSQGTILFTKEEIDKFLEDDSKAYRYKHLHKRIA
jgi:excisionase family DNA binding protein